MAIIKLGVTVVGIRGTIGGVTFSNNKSGPYAQSWARGANPISQKQSAHRAQFATFGHAWLSLSAANQALWDTYAAAAAQELTNPLGETFFATGSVWFIKINLAREQAGLAQLSVAPVLATPAAPTLSSLVIQDTSGSKVVYPSGEFDPDFAIVVFLAMGNTQSVLSFGVTHKFLQVDTTPGLVQQFFQVPLVAAWGEPLPNRRWEALIARQNTEGRRSPFTSIQVNTT